MQAFTKSYNPEAIEWSRITNQPGDPFEAMNLDYEYSILGYDLAAGKLDMMMKFSPEGGYCEPHSHVAATTLFILFSRATRLCENWEFGII